MRERRRFITMRLLPAVSLLIVVAARHDADHLQAAAAAVAWTSLVNTTVSGDVVQKTAGCNGCQDAGAISAQEIASGDGYIEFTVGEANTLFAAGLSHGNGGTTYADIDFAFRFNGAGSADVLENGIYVGGDTLYAAGDVFRVALAGGKVRYSRNGVVVLERTKALQYPYLLDASLLTVGATIRHALIESVVPSA